MTLDDICETFDEFGVSGDTPIRLKFDGQVFDVAGISSEPDGTVTFELEEAEPLDGPQASIHWGGDGI